MTQQNSKKALFENMPVPKAIATLAIPTIISQLINLIYNVADTFYVGRTGDPYKIAGVSLAFTIFFINISIANLYGMGGGSLMARLLGNGESKRARTVSVVSIYGTLATGLLYSLIIGFFMRPILYGLGASANTYAYAATYTFYVVVLGTIPLSFSMAASHLLRNIGYSRQASLGLSGGGILNILLDPLFMFVLFPKGQEVFGAALATFLSNVASMIYFIIVIQKYSGESVISLNPVHLKEVRKEDVKELFSVGIPSALVTGLFDVGLIFLNARMSLHGDIQLAAMGIVQKVERLPNCIGLGLSQGMMPLVAYNYSSGNHKRMKEVIRTARMIGIVIALLCTGLYQIFARELAEFFMNASGGADSGATIDYAATFLRIRCCAAVLMFLNYHSSYSMQALGDGKGTLAHTIIRQIVFNIPAILLLDRFFGEIGLAWALFVSEALGAAAAILLLNTYIKKNNYKMQEV